MDLYTLEVKQEFISGSIALVILDFVLYLEAQAAFVHMQLYMEIMTFINVHLVRDMTSLDSVVLTNSVRRHVISCQLLITHTL